MSDLVEHQFEKEQICMGNVHEGDHLVFPGIDGQYKRHVICTYASADGDLIEITEYIKSDPFSFELGKVLTQIISYQELKKEKVVKLKCLTKEPLSNEETAERAKSRVGKNCCDGQCNNCEHFAFWCKYGRRVGLPLYDQFKKEAVNIADFKHQFKAEQIYGNVREGDHLISPGIDGQYKHHVICTRAPADSDEIETTEYTENDQFFFERGKVRTQTVSYQKLKEEKVVKLICLTKESLSNRETVKRAKSRVGENSYNVLSNNCEHFAFWCKYDRRVSLQLYDQFKKEIVNMADFEHQFETEQIYWNVHEGDHLEFPGINGQYKRHAICIKAPADSYEIDIIVCTKSDSCSSGLSEVRTLVISYWELKKDKIFDSFTLPFLTIDMMVQKRI